MPKKKNKKPSPFRAGTKLRVKNSYYTFSKEYPAGNLHIKNMRSRNKRSPKMKAVLAAMGFIVIVVLSFFSVNLALEISYKKPDTSASQQEITDKPFISTEGVKALYMPSDKLGDEKYIKRFVSRIRRKNANSVVIDFKTQQGKLAYTSLHDYAIKGKCAMYDNDTVRKAIDLFSQYDINIVAGIYCFSDTAVSSQVKSISVKYMDTAVNWLDTDGNGWLNPCSKRSQNYIINIMRELNEMGITAFILNNACFPDSSNTSSASYPGLKVYKNHNDALQFFLNKAKSSLPKNCFILLNQSADTALSSDNKLYYGSMTKSAVDGFAINSYERPKEYVIDKKTDFSSILSLYTTIQNQYGKKAFVPIINTEEYSGSYLRHMKKAGIQNFILYNENGEY